MPTARASAIPGRADGASSFAIPMASSPNSTATRTTTTNNRMELMAAIEGLRATRARRPVILRSDSQYLVKTMNDGWRRTKNVDLWKQLDDEVARHDVRFEWVRGHAGDARNEEADALAREAARSAAKGRAPRRPGDASVASAATPPPLSAAGRAAQGAARPAAESGERARPAGGRRPVRPAERQARLWPRLPLRWFVRRWRRIGARAAPRAARAG